MQADGTGPANQRGLDFYRRLVDGLLERDIAPMATLFHWDLPQALQDAGGWESRDVAYRFADYAEAVYDALGDAVPVWLTVNEPKTVVQNGYLQGHHAPGHRDPDAAYLVAHHLQLAHGLAVRALRATGSAARIGPAFNLHPCYPADDSDGARAAAALHDGYENRLYLDSVLRGRVPGGRARRPRPGQPDGPRDPRRRPRDHRQPGRPARRAVLHADTTSPRTAARSRGGRRPRRAGSRSTPTGCTTSLTRVTRDYGPVPLTVTENGLPCPDRLGADGGVDDAGRVALPARPLRRGPPGHRRRVPLESFHVWSLMDNFEWNEGYEQRWGLVYVDYPTQQRILKRSAHWYRTVIADNCV